MARSHGAEASAAREPARGAWSSAAGAGHARTIAGRRLRQARGVPGRCAIASAASASLPSHARISLTQRARRRRGSAHRETRGKKRLARQRSCGPPGARARTHAALDRVPPPCGSASRNYGSQWLELRALAQAVGMFAGPRGGVGRDRARARERRGPGGRPGARKRARAGSGGRGAGGKDALLAPGARGGKREAGRAHLRDGERNARGSRGERDASVAVTSGVGSESEGKRGRIGAGWGGEGGYERFSQRFEQRLSLPELI